jgi:chlorophyll synthase
MAYLDTTYEISPLKMIRHVFKHMAITFWGVSIVPFYIAWVFAFQKMYAVPSWDPSFVNFIIGIIVVGPLLGGSTLLFNDYWDSEVDKISRRKSDFPMSKGMISKSTIFKVSIALMILTIFVALIISIIFTLIIIGCIILSVLYSALPIRLKSRPGLDLVINATGAGILCSFAGWVLVKPILEFPFFWLLPMFFGVSALFIPTTIIDYDSDKKNGVTTIAVKLGQQKAFYLGLISISIANAGIIFMGLNNYLITPRFVYAVWPIAIAQVIMYWVILRKQTFHNVFRTIVGLAALLTFGNILLLLYYTEVIRF